MILSAPKWTGTGLRGLRAAMGPNPDPNVPIPPSDDSVQAQLDAINQYLYSEFNSTPVDGGMSVPVARAQIFAGVPNIAVYIGGAALGVMLLGALSGGRRR